jgi:(+)-abscisic acid 8'-hydroxylase
MFVVIYRYGSIFKTHILGCPCVMISSPEAAKFVLVTRAHLFKPTFPASKEKMLGKQAIFFHQGDYHTKLRKLVLRAFMPEAIKNIIPDIESLAKDSIQSWEGRLITTFQEMKTVSNEFPTINFPPYPKQSKNRAKQRYPCVP